MKVYRLVVIVAAFCCQHSVTAVRSLLVHSSPPLTKLSPMDNSAESDGVAQLLPGVLRGGDSGDGSDDDADDIADDIADASYLVSESEEDITNPMIRKIRNAVRSLMEIGERKSPTIIKMVRELLERVESLLGVHVLPLVNSVATELKLSKPKPKTKKSKKNKKKKTKAVATQLDASDVSAATPATKVSKTSQSKATSKAHAHTMKAISRTNPNYRIQRELKEFIQSPPPNLSVKVGSNIRIWIITMTGANNTVYEGETYKLRVQFPKDYPIVPPSVYFMPPPPQHEHVYTNGDICLSLLGKDWRPTMTAQSIAVSILSILSSAQTKSLPMDNARHSQNKPGQYQKDWIYHDDNC